MELGTFLGLVGLWLSRLSRFHILLLLSVQGLGYLPTFNTPNTLNVLLIFKRLLNGAKVLNSLSGLPIFDLCNRFSILSVCYEQREERYRPH